MRITNAFIEQRIAALIREKQEALEQGRTDADKLYSIKMKFPKCLRTCIFGPFNPFYASYVLHKQNKRRGQTTINLSSLHPFAVNFADYCNTHQLDFDTSLYYPSADEEEITSFIDNRLKSLVPGYNQIELSDDRKDIYSKKTELKKAIKKNKEGYCLSLNGYNYFLPENKFEEHTYIHAYGLKYLPDYLKDYIKGKDILDIGAYLGDTAIFFQQNYAPRMLYAYEPVKRNANRLATTVAKNAISNIIVVNKGIGKQEGETDIYINPQELSGCTTNTDMLGKKQLQKETIRISTIDQECENRHIGLIKMDIEGAEYSAIQGALKTIKRDKPVLLISLYHTGKDFFEIPPLIKEALPDYKFRFINIELLNPFSEKILAAYPEL